jgi:hypothetical protein
MNWVMFKIIDKCEENSIFLWNFKFVQMDNKRGEKC